MSDHALLLVNLGSPKSTSVLDVKNYLNQFLMDPYVIQMPWLLRRLLVSFILSKRPAASAHAYESIWYKEGSPLIVLSYKLLAQMDALWSYGPVKLAMRYGEPSIEHALIEFDKKKIKQITLAPLYPHFAQSTVTTVVDQIKQVIKKYNFKFNIKQLMPFYDHPLYIDALYQSIKPHLQGSFDHILFSFHGLPINHITKLISDTEHDLTVSNTDLIKSENMQYCYRSQCLRSAELLVKRANLDRTLWSISFQSRLGRAKWLEPYTTNHIDQLIQQGVKRLLVLCPSFIVDCLETLEEINIQERQHFLDAGGESFTLVPCLNDNPLWANTLNQLCQSEKVRPLNN